MQPYLPNSSIQNEYCNLLNGNRILSKTIKEIVHSDPKPREDGCAAVGGGTTSHSDQYLIQPYNDPTSNESIEYQRTLHFHYNYYGRFINNLQEQIPTERFKEIEITPKVKLHIRTSQLESNLLFQAGKRVVPPNNQEYDFPPCIYDQGCVSYLYYKCFHGLTEPVIGCSSMDQEEYDEFLLFGEVGSERQPCVNCYRFYFSNLHLYHQRQVMRTGENIIKKPISNSHEMVLIKPMQKYYNLFDEEGGYCHEYMDINTIGNLSFQPIVRLNGATIVCYKAQAQQGPGLWRFDQSNLIWSSNRNNDNGLMIPKPGENIQHFLWRSKMAIGKDNISIKSYTGRYLIDSIISVLLQRPYKVPSYLSIQNFTILLHQKKFFDRTLINRLVNETDGLISFLSTLIYDAALDIPMNETYIYVEDDRLNWMQVACDLLLDPKLYKYVQNLSYFSSLANVTNPMLKLFGKSLLQRCNTRTASIIIKQKLVVRWIEKYKEKNGTKRFNIHYDSYAFTSLKSIVLCFLLGTK